MSDKVLLATANPALSVDKGRGIPPSLPWAASPVWAFPKGSRPGGKMRTNRVTVRLTTEAISGLEAMKQRMKLRGISELIREAVDKILKSDQPELSREMAEEFKLWRKELHGVGTNLNQIAFRMNANQPLSYQQIEETLNELKMHLKVTASNIKKVRNDLNV